MENPDGGMEKILAIEKSITGMIDLHRLVKELKEMEIQQQRTIEDLQSNVNKYRTFLDNIPLRFFIKNKDLSYRYCSQSYADDLKKQPEEIFGRTDRDFFPSDLAEKFISDDKKILETGALENIEDKYFVSGQELIVHMVKAPLRDEKGSIIGLIGIFWDITKEKHKKEEALRQLAHIEVLMSNRMDELEETSRRLQQETSERQQVEERLKKTEDELEETSRRLQQESSERRQVDERLTKTMDELEETSRRLQQETSERQQVDERLRKTEDEREETSRRLQQETSERRQVDERLTKTMDELEETSRRLQQETSERQQAEERLKQTEDEREETSRRLQQETSERRQVDERLTKTMDELEETSRRLQQETSERQQVDERLKQTEEILQTMVEGIGAALAVLREEDLMIVQANKKLEGVLGIRREEMEDKKCLSEFIAAGDLERIKEQCLTTRSGSDGLPGGREYRFVDQQGNGKDIFVTMALIPGTRRITASFLDVTEHNRLKKALQRSEERHQGLVEKAPVAIGVIQKGVFKFINPGIIKIFGYSQEELASQPVLEFIHTDDREMDKLLFKELNDGELPQVFFFKILTKDGTIRWVEDRVDLIHWEGSPATINFFTDITLRKQAEDELINSIQPFRNLIEKAQKVLTTE